MSARALTAVAALTAALTGPVRQATAQTISDAQPAPPAGSAVGISHVGGTAPSLGGNPYLGGMRGADPAIIPVTGNYAAPSYDPGMTAGPALPTDGLGGGMPRGPKYWLGAEYLLYWTKDSPLPVPIATVGPTGSTALLGAPGTQVILGGTPFNFNSFSGVRVIGGLWFGGDETIGIEGSLFVLPTKSESTARIVGTDILPVLARPFYDTTINAQNSRLLTSPGLFAGGVQATADSELWGADVSLIWRALDNGGRWTIDTTAGFKFLSLEESVTVNDFSNALAGGVAYFGGQGFIQPATTYVTDRFNTTNHFYGGTIGARANLHVEAFKWTFGGKLGFGNVRQSLRVDSTTTLAGGGYPSPVTIGGGFFGVGPNSGTFTRDEFAFVPELSSNLTVQVTSRMMVTFGYSVLWITEVARPGDQMSIRINPTQVPTSQNFGATFGQPTTTGITNSSTYWAQGFNFGLSIGY